MIAFRNRITAESGMKLLVYTNRLRIAEGVSPFTFDSERYTTMMNDRGAETGAGSRKGFDIIMGGARRDEEKSRAKERICLLSFRWPQVGP